MGSVIVKEVVGFNLSNRAFVVRAEIITVLLFRKSQIPPEILIKSTYNKYEEKLSCKNYVTRGLYFKTFYGSNFCCNVISNSVYQQLDTSTLPKYLQARLVLTRVYTIIGIKSNGWGID